MHKLGLLIGFLLSLGGCASPKMHAIPKDYSGPRVSLADSIVYADDGEKTKIFYVDTIDGEAMENAMRATRRATAGKGLSLITLGSRRDIPVRKMRIHIVGTHVTAAPIQEMASRMKGTFFEVNGDVEFEPLEGKSYVVMGELKKEGSSVWIQTETGGEVVTTQVTNSK